MGALLLLLGLGCAPAPDPCAAMCVQAEALYGACLAAWGTDWEAAGHADGEAFRGACETWAWEMRLLEADAVRRGDLDEAGAVDATCATREEAFLEAQAGEALDCDAYTTIAWDEVPW